MKSLSLQIYIYRQSPIFSLVTKTHFSLSYTILVIDIGAALTVVSIQFSPLSSVELTTSWYQLHNGDYK